MDRRSLGLKYTERLRESFEALVFKKILSPLLEISKYIFGKTCNLNVMISCLRQTQTMDTKRLFTPRQKNDFSFPPCFKKVLLLNRQFSLKRRQLDQTKRLLNRAKTVRPHVASYFGLL